MARAISRRVGTLTGLAVAAWALGCGGGGGPAQVTSPITVGPDGLRLAAGAGSLMLRPRVHVDGAWRGAGADGACAVDSVGLRCPAGPGSVVAWAEGSVVRVAFEATAAATVEGLELVGVAELPGARGWVSNGYQSWSQSGVLALGAAPSEAALAAALAARGDAEVIRTGEELSWAWTAVGGAALTLVAGAVSAERFEPWVQVWRGAGDLLEVRLVCGLTGERVSAAAGSETRGEAWHVALDPDEATALRTYAAALPSRLAEHPVEAEAGWNSWYELWDDVDPEAVLANARLARGLLTPQMPPGAPPLRVVIDDGWQRAWGDWRPAEHFPRGIEGVAQDLAAEGFTAGVWLAPLLVAEGSPVAVEHPEWLVQGASYNHLSDGKMGVLDPTHPGAAAHLAETIARIRGWGFGLLKIDFLFAGTFSGTRYEDVTGLEAYQRALAIIREAAGPDTILLAVGAPALPSLPWVEAWRVGPDIAVEPFGPAFPFIANELRSIGARWPLCEAVLCDGDPPLLRALDEPAVDAGAWTAAVAGGALFLSDDLRALPEDRLARGLPAGVVATALAGRPSVPETLFAGPLPTSLVSALADHLGGDSSHVVPVRWRLPDGRRLAFNVSDAPIDVDATTVPPRSARLLPEPR
jgi:hypothetical protein